MKNNQHEQAPESVRETVVKKWQMIADLGENTKMCKQTQFLFEIFGVVKDGKINLKLSSDYLDKQLSNKSVSDYYKIAVKYCLEMIKDKSEDYAKEKGFKTSTCDPHYELMAICILIRVVAV